MKELSVEEKAKLYDKAIAHARSLLKIIGNATLGNLVLKNEFKNMFPVLEEGEDERIRKWIRKELESKYVVDNIVNNEMADKTLAWLEKQGEQKPNPCDGCINRKGCINCENGELREVEQKPAEFDDTNAKRMFIKALERVEEQNNKGYKLTDCDKNSWWEDFKICTSCTVKQKPTYKVEPNFKIGDFIVNDYCMGRIVEITNNAYLLDTEQGIPFSCRSTRLWTIQDAKDGDVLCYKDEISLYRHDIKNCTKQETTFGGFVYYCCYDGKRFVVDSLYSLTEQDKMDIHPATKEQRDTLEKAIADAGYRWDKEKLKLEKI